MLKKLFTFALNIIGESKLACGTLNFSATKIIILISSSAFNYAKGARQIAPEARSLRKRIGEPGCLCFPWHRSNKKEAILQKVHLLDE